MLRYYYALAPLVIVGTVVLLALPWLALIALVVFVLAGFGALAALGWAIVFTPYALGRALGRRRHGRHGTSPGAASASLSLVEREEA
jgi:hypothetical protein